MRLGLWCGVLVLAGAATGCLTPNPALTDSGGETEGDTESSTGTSASSSPTTDNPSTTQGPSTTQTSTEGTTVDPDTSDTEVPTTNTDTEDETTGPAACGSGNVCAPEVPADWAGPVVWAETSTDDPQPSCPADYGDFAFTAFDDLQAPPAECTCDCGEASGVNCAGLTLGYYTADSACGGAADDTFSIALNGACNPDPSSGSGRYYSVEDPGVADGSCSPSDGVDVPPAGFGLTSTVCGGGEVSGGECAGDAQCVPVPPEGFESRLCIWQSGETTCQGTDYTDRFIRHGDFSDDRNCTTCTCGDPTRSCEGSVVLHPGAGCGVAPSAVVPIGGSCVVSGGNVEFAAAGMLTVADASCAPSGGVPTGEAEPEDPFTLCCMSL